MVQESFSPHLFTHLKAAQAKSTHEGLVQPFALSHVHHRRSSCYLQWGTRLSPFLTTPIFLLPFHHSYLSYLLFFKNYYFLRGGGSRNTHGEGCDYVLIFFLTHQHRLCHFVLAVSDIIACVLQQNTKFHSSPLLSSVWLWFL